MTENVLRLPRNVGYRRKRNRTLTNGRHIVWSTEACRAEALRCQLAPHLWDGGPESPSPRRSPTPCQHGYHVRRPPSVEAARLCRTFSKIKRSCRCCSGLDVCLGGGENKRRYHSNIDGLHFKRFKCCRWESQITAYDGETHQPDDGSDTGWDGYGNREDLPGKITRSISWDDRLISTDTLLPLVSTCPEIFCSTLRFDLLRHGLCHCVERCWCSIGEFVWGF